MIEISYVILFIFIIVSIYLLSKNYKLLKEEKKNYKEKLDKENEKILNEKKGQLNEYIEQSLKDIENRKKENQNFLTEIKESNIKLIENEISEWAQSAQEAENFMQKVRLEENQKELNLILNEIQKSHREEENLINTLKDYKSKIDTINKEILRKKEILEKEDFYKICIDENSKKDIEILNSIKQNLHKTENLDKLIYESYISKPTLEMAKRILGGKSPSGIYKITRLKTDEIYIGKSTDVKARWIQHTKSCFNCGTISFSTLHRTMQKDMIWNFTFELLEEVPKDKLTEREKYWINFYDSKKYGLNEKE